MVLNSVLDSKEEGPDIPKRKVMENTVNNNPDENPSVTSKMSDNSSEVDFPPQAVITWLLVSVAVGLVTIYTMIQFISNKLTKEIGGKKTEEHKNTTELSNQAGRKQDTTNYDLKTKQENGNETDERGKMKENGCDSLDENLMILEDGALNAEKRDFSILDALENGDVERLETNESLVCEDAVKCTKCQNNEASVHMGTGFSGRLSIETEASDSEELTCSKTFTSNDENSNTTENVTTCRSTATLENHNVNPSTPVTVNYVQIKCSAEQDLIGAKLEDEFRTENKIDSGDNHPPSTINCIQTSVKCLNCGVSSQLHSKDCNKSNGNSQSTFDANFGLEDSLNPCQIEDNKINAPVILLQNFDAEDNDFSLHTTQPKDCTENNAATKTISDSLNFLANYHTPRETTDGLVLSKNTTEDVEFIFPQDYETTTEKQPTNCSIGVEELETPKSRYLKYVRNDPIFSKSLDSQMEVLKKGCELLDKKPSKSSLRNAGSEGNLEKFVHFPEDIRHIRTVHKYDSFDRYVDAEESALNAEKQRTQSLDN